MTIRSINGFSSQRNTLYTLLTNPNSDSNDNPSGFNLFYGEILNSNPNRNNFNGNVGFQIIMNETVHVKHHDFSYKTTDGSPKSLIKCL